MVRCDRTFDFAEARVEQGISLVASSRTSVREENRWAMVRRGVPFRMLLLQLTIFLIDASVPRDFTAEDSIIK